MYPLKLSAHENKEPSTKYKGQSLALNSKRGIGAGWLQIDFLNLIYHGPLRTGSQIVFERFDIVGWAFRQRFHGAVRTISHVANDLVTSGSALGEEAIADALHISAD